MKPRTHMFTIAGCIALALASQGQAADFAERNELAARSARSGLGREQVALLKALPGQGRQKTADILKARFRMSHEAISFAGVARTEDGPKGLSALGPGWLLNVDGDGTRVRYRNLAYLQGAQARPVPLAQRPGLESLEAIGRRFVVAGLRDMVRLGPNEELVPLFTQYQVSGGASTQAGARPDPERVEASVVVFSRTIDGVHVIGPGSKVAVLVANDGKVAGFDYDWPVYELAGRPQKVVPIQEVRNRANTLTPLRLDRADTTLKRTECGYYDAGAQRRDPAAMLQAACQFNTIERRIVDEAAHSADAGSGHLLLAHSEVVPAGATVLPDRKWPLAQKILGQALLQPALIAPTAAPTPGPRP